MKRIALMSFFCVLLVAPAAHPNVVKGMILRDLDGNRVYLDSLLAAGPVVLNFWATWCKPCRLEMPHLEVIHKQLAPKGVQFGAISLDTRRARKLVEEYVEKYDMKLPVYRDPEAIAARKFKIMAIPTTVILGQDGEVFYRTRGYRPGDEVILKKKIEELVQGSGDEAQAHEADE